MVQTLEEKITELVNTHLLDNSLGAYFLIEVLVSGSKVEIFLDSDDIVNFDICKQVSRAVEAWLDENGPLGDDYVLEVSSAGVGRPLLLPRQYMKNVERDLKVSLKQGTAIMGKLLEANEESILLAQEVTVKEGKKNIKKTIEHKLPYGDIEKAIVQIRF
jgi:ribosome maturation factor RimP